MNGSLQRSSIGVALAPAVLLALFLMAVLSGPALAHHKPGHPTPPGQQDPPGGGVHDNRGTVKIHEGAAEPAPVMRNQPKVCTFHIHAFKFHADQELTFTIAGHGGPNAGPSSFLDTALTDSNGEVRVPASGSIDLDDGMYKLSVDTGRGGPGSQDKQKVFKVDCIDEDEQGPNPGGGEQNPPPQAPPGGGGGQQNPPPQGPNPGGGEQNPPPQGPNPGGGEQNPPPQGPNPGGNPENPTGGNAPAGPPKPDRLPDTAIAASGELPAWTIAAGVIVAIAVSAAVAARRRVVSY